MSGRDHTEIMFSVRDPGSTEIHFQLIMSSPMKVSFLTECFTTFVLIGRNFPIFHIFV